MRAERERELKLTAPDDWPMPSLDPVLPDRSRVITRTVTLEALYFDTPDQTLRRLGVTLRRRTGGKDAGWHLKVPSGNARTEFRSRSKAEGNEPPEDLAERLTGVTAGQELRPVATLTTVRTVTGCRNEDTAEVLEIADDRVSSATLGSESTLSSWREIEVELGAAGTEEDLAHVGDLLRAAGAVPSEAPSKLARSLGPLTEAEPSDPLAQVVVGYLVEHARQILLGDMALRGKPDVAAVHDTRVAIRRFRSTLRMFAALLPEDAAQLDDDLRWVAGLLGRMRDVDVLAERLDADVDALPAEHVLGPVKREFKEAFSTTRREALEAWRTAGDDERHPRSLATLAAWLVEVPVRDALDISAKQVLGRARRKARQRLDEAGADPALLHRARKATKRLRYTGELLGAESGKAAKEAKRAKHLQKVLGAHQDDVLAIEFLLRLGGAVGTRKGHNGFTYGLLMAGAQQHAAELRHQLREQ